MNISATGSILPFCTRPPPPCTAMARNNFFVDFLPKMHPWVPNGPDGQVQTGTSPHGDLDVVGPLDGVAFNERNNFRFADCNLNTYNFWEIYYKGEIPFSKLGPNHSFG